VNDFGDPTYLKLYLLFLLTGGQGHMKNKSIELSAHELQTKMKKKSTAQKIKVSEIDYSDILKFSSAGLKKFKRVGRPLVGYQSLINEILKKVV